MYKIALVELSTSHTEIVEPTIKAINYDSQCQIDVIMPELGLKKIKNKTIFNNVYTIEEEYGSKQAYEILQKNKYDLILLNSAQGKNVRNLVLRLLFNRTPIIGFHHNPQSLIRSFTQKIISLKVNKYIVLADFNKQYLVDSGYNGARVEVFYPISQPALNHNIKATEQAAQKCIAIPGVLEQDRRDYLGLINFVKSQPELYRGYKFLFLGNSLTHDGPAIKAKVAQTGLAEYFEFYDGYVSDEELNTGLLKSKYIMSLIHPSNRYFSVYLKTKISGAYNLAYAYQMPLLLHESFSEVKEFADNTVFYNESNLSEKIKIDCKINTQAYDKFAIAKQSVKLRNFLGIR